MLNNTMPVRFACSASLRQEGGSQGTDLILDAMRGVEAHECAVSLDAIHGRGEGVTFTVDLSDGSAISRVWARLWPGQDLPNPLRVDAFMSPSLVGVRAYAQTGLEIYDGSGTPRNTVVIKDWSRHVELTLQISDEGDMEVLVDGQRRYQCRPVTQPLYLQLVIWDRAAVRRVRWKRAVIGATNLSRDLLSLFLSGRKSDVTLCVAGECFPAHSLILETRSPVFRAMLETPMQEAATRTITVEGLEVQAVVQLLRFIYTGSVEEEVLQNMDRAMRLLEAAHRYEVKELAGICVESVGKCLNVEDVAEVFQAADNMGLEDLRLRCLTFIAQNVSEVQATDSFERLVQQRPALLKDVLAAVAPPARKRKRPASNATTGVEARHAPLDSPSELARRTMPDAASAEEVLPRQSVHMKGAATPLDKLKEAIQQV